jgi:hypothetical protein
MGGFSEGVLGTSLPDGHLDKFSLIMLVLFVGVSSLLVLGNAAMGF